jgi:perosamine synthetase
MRDELRIYLKEKGIGTQIHYKPVHQQPLYQHIYADCPIADDQYARSLSLPMHVGLNDDEIKYVANSIKEALGK